jgi:ribosome-associated heat shock protein Hsp15
MKSQHEEKASELRIDKWLWAARFFKTRELAARACDIGRIEVNGQRAKPSRAVRIGDRLNIRNENGAFEAELLLPSAVRGPAAAAQALYRETEESKARREHEAEQRKTLGLDALAGEGRPSRRDRQARGRLHGNP